MAATSSAKSSKSGTGTKSTGRSRSTDSKKQISDTKSTTSSRSKNSGSSSAKKAKPESTAVPERRRTVEVHGGAPDRMRLEIVLWASLLISVLLCIGNFGFGGLIGDHICRFFFGVFGVPAYALPFLILGGTFFMVSNIGNRIASTKLISAGVFLLFLFTFIELFVHKSNTIGPLSAYHMGFEEKSGGGLIGGFLAMLLVNGFGLVGAYVIDIIGMIMSLVVITDTKAFFYLHKRGIRYRKKRRSRRRIRQRMIEQQREQALLESRRRAPAIEDKAAPINRPRPVPADTSVTSPVKRNSDEVGEIGMDMVRGAKEVDSINRISLLSGERSTSSVSREVKAAPVNESVIQQPPVQEPVIPQQPATAEVPQEPVREIRIHQADYGNTANTPKPEPINITLDEPPVMTSPFTFEPDPAAFEDDFSSGAPAEGIISLEPAASESLADTVPPVEEASVEPLVTYTEVIDIAGADTAGSDTADAISGKDAAAIMAEPDNTAEPNVSVPEISAPGMAKPMTAPESMAVPVAVSSPETMTEPTDTPAGPAITVSAEESPQQDTIESEPEEEEFFPEPVFELPTAKRPAAPTAASAFPAAPATPVPSSGPAAAKQDKASDVSPEDIENEIVEKKPKKPYVLPSTDLLDMPKNKGNGNTEEYLRATAEKLETTLRNFGVEVTVTDVSCGPTVTRYELEPKPGVKVSRITNLSDDIKLNLAAADIRIEAPIPGKSAVGIEVPNKETVMVSIRELIEDAAFRENKSNIAFSAGRDIGGNVIISDIAKMPHLLIAGSTGSGKSVCINTIIMSILYRANPEDVKFIMIDPKVVELSVYNGIPHLLIPVVTDPKKASGALQWAVHEMTDRYKKFADSGVRDMKGYNAKIDHGHIKLTDGTEVAAAKMPQIVVIVDELADLMMVSSSEVEEAICRLAQLARAAGIHLIIATQRPSVNVITGLIKANMPSRIAFAVTSGVDSRTILDMIGAEKLLGKGDMLYYPQGYTKPLRVQGAFVSDDEVARVTEFIKEQVGDAEYDESITEHISAHAEGGSSSQGSSSSQEQEAGDGRDSYFADAARLIIEKQKGSIGMLQRYFRIGFNRAARIMDQLEDAGVVGPEEGTKPRQVLLTLEQFDQIKDNP